MDGWKTIWGALLTSAVVFGGMVGCGKSKARDLKPVVTVKGRVLFRGQPATRAIVVFHPISDPNPRALRSNGTVGPDGSFSLTTFVKDDGAPKGEYAVTVYWPDASKKPGKRMEGPEEEEQDLPDWLGGRFCSRNGSILRAAIGDKPVEFAPVDLGSDDVTKSREYRLREK